MVAIQQRADGAGPQRFRTHLLRLAMSNRDIKILTSASDGLPGYADDRMSSLLEYWRSMRDGDALPPRGRMDPMDMRDKLANVFILDVDGDKYRFRLVGEALNERYDGRLKGKTINEVLRGEVLDETLEEHGICARDRAPVFTRNTEQTRSVLEDFQVYQRLLLPLADDGRAVDAIFGCMLFMPTEIPS